MNTTYTATITATTITVEAAGFRADSDGFYRPFTEVLFTEARPENLAAAEQALNAHGFGMVVGWDLGPAGTVVASVLEVDNRFNGTYAARLWEAVGTTHDEFDLIRACEVANGDIITDREQCAAYVVAGCSTELGTTRLHQVGEGKVWDDRYTGQFGADQLVWTARRR